MKKRSMRKTPDELKKNYSSRIFHLLLLTFIFYLPSFATPDNKEVQQGGKTITGVVKDHQGEPLPGVVVAVKGTTTGTYSDIDGKYSLSVPNTNLTLTFSFIGYITQEVALNGKSSLNITMQENTQQLDEIVVVGYGSLKKSEIATAVSSIKPEDFNYGGGRDPMSLLEGKVAGLTITRTDGVNPNSNAAFQLRGVTSLSGSQSPLIVIDGIPDGNLDLLQPEDIESMEILKDGSAAAIYGSRANAGVILITTKSGRKGELRMEYSTFVTKHYLAKAPRVLTADEYRAYMNDPNNPKAGQMVDYGSSTDFYRALVDKDNLTYTHNLAISGGNDAATYRASLFYNDFDGIGLQNDRKNYGGRMSLNARGYDNMLTAQINLAINHDYKNLLGDSDDLWKTAAIMNPTLGLHDEVEQMVNPINRMSEHRQKRDGQNTVVSGKLGLEPIKNLIFSIFGSLQRDNWTESEYINVNSWESKQNHEGLGFAKKDAEQEIRGAVEPTVEYSKLFNNKHSLNAVGGYSYQYTLWERTKMENKGFLNDVTQDNDMGAGSWLASGKAKMESEKQEDKLIAFFGRVNYAYDSRYVAQISLRREGSTKFGANQKWGNFPSYSVAWNASNEEFMKGYNYLSLLKIRLGYGVTGNSGINRYQSIITMGTGGFYLSPDGRWVQTYGPSTNPNPNLKWEMKQEWNLGLDFGFLKNRIGGSIDIYNRTTKDLLGLYGTQQPPYIFSDIFINVGDIASKGVELTLNTIPVVGKGFMWKADFAASYTDNTLKSLSNDLYEQAYIENGNIGGSGDLGNAIRVYPGDRMGNFYGKRFAGFTDEGKWLFYNKDGEKVLADQIGDGDMGVIGNGVPKFYLAMSNYIQYKNFDLNIVFRGKFGFDVLNVMDMQYGNKIALPNNVLKRAITTHANLNDTYQYSDYYLEKGDFVKVDNITVGYNFKSKSGNKKIPQFRVYFTGRDLLTMTGYSGLDPEVSDTGLNTGLESVDRYPVTRSFTLGLNIIF